MIIRKMTACFGMLQNSTLELREGLNIVFAPNESGKSTWCSFIKAMLYGIETGAREKGGVKPDKLRFAPWSGAPMAGSMDIEYEGQRITLLRQGRESAPMRDFSAVLTGSSAAARGIDPSAAGETLLGVSKDVFERSAFIGQGKVAVGASPELEKRISAIVQTGEESSSVTEAEERLKAAARRRRYNKSGRLSEIEKELEEIRESLAECAREAQKGEELKKAKAEALERRDALTAKVAEIRKGTRHDTLEKLSESRGKVKAQEDICREIDLKLEETGRKLESGVFGEDEPHKCRERLSEDENKLVSLEKRIKKGGAIAVYSVLLAVFLFVCAALVITSQYVPSALPLLLCVLCILRIIYISKNCRIAKEEKIAILAVYKCLSAQEAEKALAEHDILYSEHAAFIEKRKLAYAVLDDVNKTRAELEAALLKDLDFTEGGTEAAQHTKLLEDAERALRSIREQSAAWEGRQSALKDPELLKTKLDALSSEHEKLTEEYDALMLALATLKDAGEEISHRITPKLSSLAAGIFSKLTASRYDAILLDKEFRAEARLEGDPIPRDASFLSAGTVDQLYLAVRLAICELALPPEKSCPVILDDALVNFDDERCGMALKLLAEMAKDRQFVLFTCHKREADLMRSVSGMHVAEI